MLVHFRSASYDPHQNYHVCHDPVVEPALPREIFLLGYADVEAFISRQTDDHGQGAGKIQLSFEAAKFGRLLIFL
jgi:hypothetical protein